MKYFVTFGTTRSKSAPNPFGHTCLALSKLDDTTSNQMEIIDLWGFYGMPNKHREKGIFDNFKKLIKFDLDFMGNHGYFKHEEPRFSEFNSQYYLNGSTFELTENQFQELHNRCKKVVDDQEQAIKEAVEELNSIGQKLTPLEQFKCYAYEHLSPLIFEYEKNKSKNKNQPSRLKPFDFTLSTEWRSSEWWESYVRDPLKNLGVKVPHVGWWGLHLRDSQNCKVLMLDLLQDILTENQINSLTVNGTHPSVPRLSGPSEDLSLYCTGDLNSIKKRDGSAAYFHDCFGYKEETNVRCYFAIPPQHLDAQEETKKLLAIESHLYPGVKKIVEKLLKLRWFLINEGLSENSSLLKQLIQHVTHFATIDPERPALEHHNSLVARFGLQGFFSVKAPCNTNLFLRKATGFLDLIYQVIAEEQNELTDISGLSIEQKKKLCDFLGKSYPDSLWSEQERFDALHNF